MGRLDSGETADERKARMNQPDALPSMQAPHAPAGEQAGLTSAEAARRLSQFGPNSVAAAKESAIRTFLEQLWAPVPWMLEAAVVVQIVLGEDLEAAVIGGLLLFNAALSFFQRGRAQAALDLLKSKLALSAAVRRDGVWTLRPAAELVPGDVVKLSLGAVVPADVRLSSGFVLLDQSALTGESVPVEATAGDRTYAGALVRRGEAVAEVTATGARTCFGRTAELVEIAHAESAEQRAVFGVVRNLAILNGVVLAAMAIYARHVGMALDHVVPLTLTGLLASVPATFTLATALTAQKLTQKGVLPTRLSAVHEAATMDVLCSDKTGTLTQNALQVVEVRPMPGQTRDAVLTLTAAASAEGGMDPVDAAIRAAARASGDSSIAPLRFTPFDPATKTAEAQVMTKAGPWRVVKGAFAAVSREAAGSDEASSALDALTSHGHRALAVAAGPADKLTIIGLIALSAPRADSGQLIDTLAKLGVRTVAPSWSRATRLPRRRRSRDRWAWSAPFVRRGRFPIASGHPTIPSMLACFPKTSSVWSRPSKRRGTPSACAATAPTTRRRSVRPRSGSRCRPRPISQNPPRPSSSPLRGSEGSSRPWGRAGRPSSAF